MKKISIVFPLFLGAILLSGCGQLPSGQDSAQKNQSAPVPSQSVAQESPFLSQSSVSSSAQSDPSGSQTYENDKYGFRFQYPAGKSIEEKSLPEDMAGARFYVLIPGTTVGVYVWGMDKESSSDPLSAPDGMTPSSQEDTTIAGLKGRIHHGDKEDVYVVAKNGYQYFIQSDSVDNALLVQIVKSFSFTR